MDITERKSAEEQRDLVLREMSHRIKNLFAVTRGVVALSARSARSAKDMATAIQGRLAALTYAHELMLPGLRDTGESASQNTTLHGLIRAIVAPYVGGRSPGREGVVVAGPDWPIGGNAITNAALVLHELATNAAKYGALSSPEGVVSVDSSTDNDMLSLTWKERGGPALASEPSSEGFGSLLTRTIVQGQLGGQLSKTFEPEGLTVHLSVPLDRLKN